MHGAQQGPDVSDNESDGDDVNAADKPISLSETRKEIKYRIEKKVGLCYIIFSVDHCQPQKRLWELEVQQMRKQHFVVRLGELRG